jgi:hypothetical protein
MNLTEKEAREKWCVNWASVPIDGNPLCGSSQCMAWRWAYEGPYGEPAMKKEEDEYRETGYCGIAGKLL